MIFIPNYSYIKQKAIPVFAYVLDFVLLKVFIK